MLDNHGLAELSRRLYRHRRTVAMYGFGGVLAFGAVAAFRQTNFRSQAVLMLGSSDGNDFSQLRSIATQFGIAGAAGKGAGVNLDMVANLAKSSVILRPTLSRSLAVAADTGSHTILTELFQERSAVTAISAEEVETYLDKIRSRLDVQIDKKANTLTLSIYTPNSIASREYVAMLVRDINDYLFDLNLKRTEAERTALEKRIEGRMHQVDSAESNLAAFLSANRQFEESPTLRFEHDRLARAADLHQQILLTLTQLREQALNSSVKAAPTLSVVEPPTAAATPMPRKRLQIVLIGMLVGVFVGIITVTMRFGSDLFTSHAAASMKESTLS